MLAPEVSPTTLQSLVDDVVELIEHPQHLLGAWIVAHESATLTARL
ncbi:hypothetical protein [Rhizobium leguminosarum]